MNATAQPKLRVHDKRVKISVFAEHPQIVTPTGIAVTSKGDVLVVECHTHFPPPNTLLGIANKDKDVRVRAMAIRFGRPDASDLRKFAKANQPGLVRAAALRRMAEKKYSAELMKAAGDPDPYIRQAARRSILLAKLDVRTLFSSATTAQRESATLIVRARGSVRELPSILSDRSEVVRQIAIQWIGESRLGQHRQTVERELSQASSRLLFESCLASLELLSGSRRSGSKDEWDGRQYAFNLMNRPDTSERVQVQILRTLGSNYPGLTVARLAGMLNKARDPQLQLELVKSLRGIESASARNNELLRIAQDNKYSIRVRAESLVGYQVRDSQDLKRIVQLAVSAADQDVALEALRSMRFSGKDRKAAPILEALKKASPKRSKQWQALANRVLDVTSKTTYSPSVVQVLEKLNERPGNHKVGARIFFNKQIGRCSTCHESRGRGGRIGPDLTQIGRTMTQRRLVESILYPSREIAPRYVPWTVVREDGRTFSGMYLGHDNKDRHSYADTNGKVQQIPIREIARRLPMKKSIMPDGLIANLTLQEFRDLLAYLRASQ